MQLIKIEKPFQSLLTFFNSAGEKKNILQCFVVIFSVFISSMPSKVIIIIIIVFMFLGLNIFRALLRAHFSPRLAAKMSLSRAQNIFRPANINSIVIVNEL